MTPLCAIGVDHLGAKTGRLTFAAQSHKLNLLFPQRTAHSFTDIGDPGLQFIALSAASCSHDIALFRSQEDQSEAVETRSAVR